MAPPPAEPPRDAAATVAGGGACLLSSALRRFPSFPHSRPRVEHAAPLAAAERLVRSIAAAACELPFLRPFLSLHSHLHSFSVARWAEGRPLSAHGFAAILPGDSVAGLVAANGLTNFLNIYNSLLVVRLVLTWFPNSPPAIVGPLSTLCDPYLNIFRGIIPPLGGTLDLSPIIAFLVLNAFTSTAAALPAELPVASKENIALSCPMPLHLTMTQEKWMRRVWCKRPKNSENVE